jgi:hypothetical protein
MSVAGEEVVQFIRTEMSALVNSHDTTAVDVVETHWHQLRAELHKAYNKVELFGSESVRSRGKHMWRTARNGLNDVFVTLRQPERLATAQLAETLRVIASDLGRAGGPYMEACRGDLQVGTPSPAKDHK